MPVPPSSAVRLRRSRVTRAGYSRLRPGPGRGAGAYLVGLLPSITNRFVAARPARCDRQVRPHSPALLYLHHLSSGAGARLWLDPGHNGFRVGQGEISQDRGRLYDLIRGDTPLPGAVARMGAVSVKV